MCGIFGIINAEKKPFDYQTFCTLGICNDDRGGDSCGVFIDGKYEYGVDKKKFFADFYKDSQVIQEANRVRIALGHCRKASIGGINEATAQPVVIEEDGKAVFVLIHNGTIYNYEALAKKYIPDIKIDGLTDSQVMARIFYYKGYDVLKEYTGGAAFVVADYTKEQPEILLFKGASLETLVDRTPKEERPLFLVHSNNTLIFSSIARYLTTKKKNRTLLTCPANKLCRVLPNGGLEVVGEYDRSNKYQFRTIYENVDEYERCYGYEYHRGNTGNKISGVWTTGKGSEDSGDTTPNLRLPAHNSNQDNKSTDVIIFRYINSNDDGTYSVDNQLAQGFYFINDKGRILGSKDKDSNRVHMFFFWQGILLYNKECYKFLKKLAKSYGLTEGQLVEDYPLLVRFLSPDPFRDDQLFKDGATYIATSPDSFEICSREQWQYFMSKNCYWFDENGYVSGSWESQFSTLSSTFDDYVRLGKENIDFACLIDEFKVY